MFCSLPTSMCWDHGLMLWPGNPPICKRSYLFRWTTGCCSWKKQRERTEKQKMAQYMPRGKDWEDNHFSLLFLFATFCSWFPSAYVPPASPRLEPVFPNFTSRQFQRILHWQTTSTLLLWLAFEMKRLVSSEIFAYTERFFTQHNTTIYHRLKITHM